MAHVLVVDDSPQVRRLVQLTLISRGHQVREAADGYEAWKMMLAERPDLVIMDVMMPGPSGLDVSRAMRDDARLVGLPIIILTADGLTAQEQAVSAGAHGFMVKPFSPSALCDLVASLLQ